MLSALIAGVVLTLTTSARARSVEKVLHTFSGGHDGGNPTGVIFDASGNLYGAAGAGGANGDGVVFELTPKSDGSWSEHVLHTFKGTDGAEPNFDSLIFDASGNLYGTTVWGGNLSDCPISGCGVVFELMPQSNGIWNEKVLYAFKGGSDGGNPVAGLIFDSVGNLYGTASQGVLFRLAPTSGGKWHFKVLHAFTGGSDGANPEGSLIFDRSGNLYGTTAGGGSTNCSYGCGVVFELLPGLHGKWHEKVLHAFSGGRDGANPYSSLVFDARGHLYGTAAFGGNLEDCYGGGCGLVFELSPNSSGKWEEKVLYAFTGKRDGQFPVSRLISDPTGNLFGTARDGGNFNGCTGGGAGCGVVFELSRTCDGGWKDRVLHVFTGGKDGGNPWAGLIFGASGNLYGTTIAGGDLFTPCGDGDEGCGVVFEITP